MEVHPDAVGRRLAAHQRHRSRASHSKRNTGCAGRMEKYRRMLDQGAPQFNRRGDFHGYVGLAIDITERKRAAHELRWLAKPVEQSPAWNITSVVGGKPPSFFETAHMRNR